jgi:membrane protein
MHVDTAQAPAKLRASGNRRTASWWRLLKTAASDWSEDKAPRLGAALAYYTVFSIAPLLVIAIGIAGFFFGADAVQSKLDEQLQGFLGRQGAEGVQAMIAAASKPRTGGFATVLGVAALVVGASGVFVQMKDALNTIWEVEPKRGQGIWGMVRDRLLSFAMVLAIGFLLLVTLFVSATLAALTNSLRDFIPGPDIVAHGLDLGVSLAVVTLLFALIFKYLPDAKVAWSDVWLGAAVTAVLFTIGKYAIGMYLGTASVGSAYGAAGSLVIVLLWAYYSSQILFFGAELTQAYARMFGSRIVAASRE